MREILFRGKKENGKWCYGSLITADWYSNETTYILQLGQQCQVAEKTIGQYTGLTDKNGTKIFEGDIVKYKNNSPCKIAYIDCKFVMMWDKFYRDFEQVYDDEIEVIGNIHDNPELLKEVNSK